MDIGVSREGDRVLVRFNNASTFAATKLTQQEAEELRNRLNGVLWGDPELDALADSIGAKYSDPRERDRALIRAGLGNSGG